ncbi:MoxR family ATPase [Proteiniclasticum sp. QWL-01]|uniref:AAA family ATPase n=1 Tax=Proteiniclasticum sp. QWL-01 TaxID=3036945 RepID=UPI00241158A9|nr:MoxR family ATPase [Proteiniclasticum sp. QWL-01]WFF73913.1 MoxR family ATPase [Proteiniclasticum sp. QWL-01]
MNALENIIVQRILANVRKVIVGKDNEIIDILKGILSGGHILIEDLPGLGKTTIVKALARTMDLSFSRIQFTPDLLPSDITGISIYNQKEMNFEFRPGPVFANLVLADEINRTSPKTQSALLEVMEETQVSEGAVSYQLEKPFVVLATQNPIEYEGTFNLPEAQLDRFMMKTSIGYPDKEQEMNILKNFRVRNPLDELEPAVTRQDILHLMDQVRQVEVADAINDYIVRLAEETRTSNYLTIGVSPRASLALMRLSQAQALIEGRDYVIPEDVKYNVMLCFPHRVKLSSQARGRTLTEIDVIAAIVNYVKAPR